MDRMQRDELAVHAARVFAGLFREYKSADPAVREVIEQMSEIADTAADVDEREMALTTLADALGLLFPASDNISASRAVPPDIGLTGDGVGPPWQNG